MNRRQVSGDQFSWVAVRYVSDVARRAQRASIDRYRRKLTLSEPHRNDRVWSEADLVRSTRARTHTCYKSDISPSTPGSTQRGGSSGLGHSRPHKSGRQTGLQTGLQPHFFGKNPIISTRNGGAGGILQYSQDIDLKTVYFSIFQSHTRSHTAILPFRSRASGDPPAQFSGGEA